MKQKKHDNKPPTETTLYAKRDGKYVPVNEYFTTDYMREGDYLVRIRPGHTSIISYQHPISEAEFESAVQEMKDAMCSTILRKNLERVTDSSEFNAEYHKMLNRLFKRFPDVGLLRGASIDEIVEAGLNQLRRWRGYLRAKDEVKYGR